MARENTRTGGKPATEAIVPGDVCISIGKPPKKAPPGYEWRALTSVARLETGHTPSRKRPEYWGGEVPWIGIRDATGNHGRVIHATNENTNALGISNSSARILPAETVCLSRTASVGYVVVMGRPMATSQDFVNWVCSDELNPHYLKYALLSEQRALRMFAVGSVHSTIYFPEVKAFHLCMPSRKVQDAVAATLGALDDKIELNRKMNATLEAMARALFRDWFVDFGPTRARMEGRTPYLSPDLWPLFLDRLDAEGKPEGWEAATLGAVATARNEGVDPSAISPDTPYIGLEHMPRGSIALGDWDGAGKVSSNKAAFTAGDFLFGKLRPYFHKVGVAPVSGICSTDIVVVRPKAAEWAGFVIACISDDDFVAYTDKTSTGTKMPRTSWSIMAKYAVTLPPATLARAFNATVAPMLDQIRANIHESRTLAQTRDLLLPRLMSGELRVAEATHLIEEVA